MKLRNWWKRWQEKRQLRRWAKLPVSDMAKAKADAIREAIREHRAVCRHCLNPYLVKQRDFADKFRVRAILMIPDKEPELMLCDTCFEAVSALYNPRATVPGTSNSGPRNFLIQ